MVRVFPAGQPLKSNAWLWRAHSQGYHTRMDMRGAKFHTSNRGTAAVPLVCVRAKGSHAFGIFYGQSPFFVSYDMVLADLILMIFLIQTVRFLLKPFKQPRLVAELLVSIFFFLFLIRIPHVYILIRLLGKLKSRRASSLDHVF